MPKNRKYLNSTPTFNLTMQPLKINSDVYYKKKLKINLRRIIKKIGKKKI